MKLHCALSMALLSPLLGCGDENGSPTRPENGVFEISASTFEFQPERVGMYPEEHVTFRLTSDDVRHAFKIEELDIEVEVPAGETVTAKLTGASEGTYTFYCTVPGHREQGMEGQLSVSRRPVTPPRSSGIGSSGGGGGY